MCRSAEQCAERVADRENLVRELVESLKLCYCLAEFGTTPDVRKVIAENAKRALDRAKDQQGE